MPIRVLLVEDHHLVRSGIKSLLQETQEVEVVGEACDGRQAVELARTLAPQIVLMDVAMPSLNGIESARQIISQHKNLRVIMLSMHGDRQYLFESLRAGVSGYVLKSAVFTELLHAIKTVVEDKTYLSPALTESAMDFYAQRIRGKGEDPTEVPLSPREREVLQLVAEGKSSAEVASALHISVRTVDTHRQNIMNRLNVHTIAGLTKYAIRHGLCQDI